jgi:hypothetical protein
MKLKAILGLMAFSIVSAIPASAQITFLNNGFRPGTGGTPMGVFNGRIITPFTNPGMFNNMGPGMNWNPEAYISDEERRMMAEQRAQQVAAAIQQSNQSVDATLAHDGKLTVKWSGNPDLVRKITFMLLDKDKKSLKEQTITKLPAQATLTLTNKTDYYRVTVEYLNGSKNTWTTPI